MRSYITKAVGTLCLLLLCFIAYQYVTSERSEARFKRVKNGMSKAKVVGILGKPEQVTYDSVTHTYQYCYFSGVMGKSTEPYIILDTANTVVRVVYGD